LATFNCGVGMVLLVADKDAARVTEVLTQSGETVLTLGHVAARNDEAVVIEKPLTQ
jgi:phosphoribosylformylglycinamidine cyclo-ligase